MPDDTPKKKAPAGTAGPRQAEAPSKELTLPDTWPTPVAFVRRSRSDGEGFLPATREKRTAWRLHVSWLRLGREVWIAEHSDGPDPFASILLLVTKAAAAAAAERRSARSTLRQYTRGATLHLRVLGQELVQAYSPQQFFDRLLECFRAFASIGVLWRGVELEAFTLTFEPLPTTHLHKAVVREAQAKVPTKVPPVSLLQAMLLVVDDTIQVESVSGESLSPVLKTSCERALADLNKQPELVRQIVDGLRHRRKYSGGTARLVVDTNVPLSAASLNAHLRNAIAELGFVRDPPTDKLYRSEAVGLVWDTKLQYPLPMEGGAPSQPPASRDKAGTLPSPQQPEAPAPGSEIELSDANLPDLVEVSPELAKFREERLPSLSLQLRTAQLAAIQEFMESHRPLVESDGTTTPQAKRIEHPRAAELLVAQLVAATEFKQALALLEEDSFDLAPAKRIASACTEILEQLGLRFACPARRCCRPVRMEAGWKEDRGVRFAFIHLPEKRGAGSHTAREKLPRLALLPYGTSPTNDT